jgi:hypothetical protein
MQILNVCNKKNGEKLKDIRVPVAWGSLRGRKEKMLIDSSACWKYKHFNSRKNIFNRLKFFKKLLSGQFR